MHRVKNVMQNGKSQTKQINKRRKILAKRRASLKILDIDSQTPTNEIFLCKNTDALIYFSLIMRKYIFLHPFTRENMANIYYLRIYDKNFIPKYLVDFQL